MKSSSRHRVDQELLTLMLNEIFQYKHYKRYLRDRLTHETKFTKGLKIKLARHIGCQPSYLSQVLNGDPNFTLEQATLLNDFFNHGKTEAKYFLLLLQHERAGTKRLKDFFIEEIEALREERFNLKKRLPDTEELPASTRHKYYSSWYYSAIHIMLSIPEFQSVTAISQRLRLPPSLVKGVVEFLEDSGIVHKEKRGYNISKKRVHLERESDFIQHHHINWRSQALQSVEKNLVTDMHYSTTFSLAESDFPKIKEIFLKAIEDTRSIIRPSKDEELYAITLDVFNL